MGWEEEEERDLSWSSISPAERVFLAAVAGGEKSVIKLGITSENISRLREKKRKSRATVFITRSVNVSREK